MPPGEVEFRDAVHGAQRRDVAAETGDFVVARADGVPAYQLAVVVDDAAMEVTEVVRGDDLLASTARQLLLYRALGLAAPRFAHVPLVDGEDGTRLAKRHGALSLHELRERGADPRAVAGLLAALSGLAPPGARLHPRNLVAGFSLAKILAGSGAARAGGGGEAGGVTGCAYDLSLSKGVWAPPPMRGDVHHAPTPHPCGRAYSPHGGAGAVRRQAIRTVRRQGALLPGPTRGTSRVVRQKLAFLAAIAAGVVLLAAAALLTVARSLR